MYKVCQIKLSLDKWKSQIVTNRGMYTTNYLLQIIYLKSVEQTLVLKNYWTINFLTICSLLLVEQ